MSCAAAPGRDAAKRRPHLETLDPPDPAAAQINSGGEAVYAKENRLDEAGAIPASRRRSAPAFLLPAGKRGLWDSRETEMAEEPSKMSGLPARILLATDGSRDASFAARAAADVCYRPGSELHVVHVWQGVPPSPERPASGSFLHELEARERLEEQTERLEEHGATVAGEHLRQGSPADEIAGLAEELEAGLVVVGSRGLGPVKRLVMGSVSRGVVRLASCPTLVVRGGPGAWPPTRVILGDDRSEEAKRAGDLAASLARLFEAQVFLVRTGYPETQLRSEEWTPKTQRERAVIARIYQRRRLREDLEGRARDLGKTLGQPPHVRTAVGDAADFIMEVAGEGEKPALIAVGRRGLGTIRSALLGSVSGRITSVASGPVLIAP